MGHSASSETSFVTVDLDRLQHYLDLFHDANMIQHQAWLWRLTPWKLTIFDYVRGCPSSSKRLKKHRFSNEYTEHLNTQSLTVGLVLQHVGPNPVHHAVFSEYQAKELQRRVKLAEQAMRVAAALRAAEVPVVSAPVRLPDHQDVASASESDDAREEGAA